MGGGFAMAGAAAADSGTGGSGAVATLHDPELIPDESGQITINGKGGFGGGLIQLDIAGGKWLETYCIDLKNETAPGAHYQETDWKSTSLETNPSKGKILWILQNSFPHVTALDTLAKEAGAEALTKAQAAAATQAAIWHFSDGVDAHPSEDADASKLTDYLIRTAKDLAEPSPSLSLTPGTVSGKSGAQLGPITVNSSGGTAQVGLDANAVTAGVVLTDSKGDVISGKDGKLITPAKPNDQLFVKTPAGAAAGTATLTASASTSVELGRAFMSADKNRQGRNSQTLILAGTQTVTVNATATANWAPTGPVPAFSALVDCTKKAVVVTLTNTGDQPYSGTVVGGTVNKTVTVAPGSTETVLVPSTQGQQYSIKVSGPNSTKTFTGVLDCTVTSTGGGTGGTPSPTPSSTPSGTPSPTPSRSTSASPVPSVSAGASTPAATTGGGGSLAFTGGGSSAPLIAGIAGALVLVGGGAVFAMRRRGRHGRTAA
ncbi:hypothetical protein GCM10009665_68480 [Kitasatospora nipponensis]|uniref:Thioester domain-containing protein n=1 Tax=Kitasatospora nipponensis TaxID=258049 RepID=A0ABN1X3W8_9ACTN